MWLPLSPLLFQPAAMLSTHPRDSHRHLRTLTDADTCRTQACPITQRATDKVCPQIRCCPSSPHIQDSHHTGTGRHVSSSSWAGRGRRSLVQHATHTARVQNTHTFMSSPSTGMLPVPVQHLCVDSSTPYLPHGSLNHYWVLAAQTQHSYIYPTGTPHSQVTLNISIASSP